MAFDDWRIAYNQIRWAKRVIGLSTPSDHGLPWRMYGEQAWSIRLYFLYFIVVVIEKPGIVIIQWVHGLVGGAG